MSPPSARSGDEKVSRFFFSAGFSSVLICEAPLGLRAPAVALARRQAAGELSGLPLALPSVPPVWRNLGCGFWRGGRPVGEAACCCCCSFTCPVGRRETWLPLRWDGDATRERCGASVLTCVPPSRGFPTPSPITSCNVHTARTLCLHSRSSQPSEIRERGSRRRRPLEDLPLCFQPAPTTAGPDPSRSWNPHFQARFRASFPHSLRNSPAFADAVVDWSSAADTCIASHPNAFSQTTKKSAESPEPSPTPSPTFHNPKSSKSKRKKTKKQPRPATASRRASASQPYAHASPHQA